MQNQSTKEDSFGLTWSGKETGIDSDDCVAKCIVGEFTHYYIKQCTQGNETGSFYNQNSFEFDERKIKKESHGHGKKYFEFAKVNKQVFLLYKEFLKSKNSSYLLQAQREQHDR